MGLEFVSEDGFAVVFSANGVRVRVVNVSGVPDFKPAAFTILGWFVPKVAWFKNPEGNVLSVTEA